MNPQVSLQPFVKWEIDIVGPIQPRGKKTGVHYIITTTEYLTIWEVAQRVKDCIGDTKVKFLFEYMLNMLGCPKVLMSDRGMHFLNEMITALTEEFQVYHQKSTPYHPQANGMVEAFNKILENALTKVYNAWWNDWDLCIPAVLWDYRTSCKNLIGQTPFRLAYGVETVMPMEYTMPSLCIAAFTGMADRVSLEERLAQ